MGLRYNFLTLIVAVVVSINSTALSAKVDTVRLYPKVLVMNYDPIIKSEGGKRLHEVCKWNDPHKLAEAYAADIKKSSSGIVNYRIVKWMDIDEFPLKLDGFSYTEESYLACFRGEQKWHQPDAFDYRATIKKHKIAEMVDKGEIDEVWMFGAPYFGWFESCMAGKNAFWVNGTPLPDVPCKKAFVMMGFNYERGVGEMLEDLGHRTESTLSKVFDSQRKHGGEPQNDWERFTLYDKIAPGKAACGNIHFAPTSMSDYDWGNNRKVLSTCEDWLNYPDLVGKTKMVDASEWGGGNIRAHHNWWFSHLPKAPGKKDGKLNNWWLYVIDFNKYVPGQ